MASSPTIAVLFHDRGEGVQLVEAMRMRSKKEIEKMLETYDKALNGDPDALMKMGVVMLGMQDFDTENGGVNDGKNRKRAGRENTTKKK